MLNFAAATVPTVVVGASPVVLAAVVAAGASDERPGKKRRARCSFSPRFGVLTAAASDRSKCRRMLASFCTIAPTAERCFDRSPATAVFFAHTGRWYVLRCRSTPLGN